MPFGFDPLETEKILKKYGDNENTKTYVEVKVVWKKDGTIIPISFTWDDEREYNIDKVLSIQKGNSLKVAEHGFRYRCQVGSKIFLLHYDGTRWYIK